MASYSGHSSSSETFLEDVSTTMFKQIEKMIHSTFDPSLVGRGRDAKDLHYFKISVNNIQGVKNPRLFDKYCDFQDKLRKKIGDGNDVEEIVDLPETVLSFQKSARHVDLNELYLFHGTSEYSARQIINKGFHTGTSNPRNLYGSGIYFAEKFTKADQYTDKRYDRHRHGTELTLLLCRVLMGNAYMCGKRDGINSTKFHLTGMSPDIHLLSCLDKTHQICTQESTDILLCTMWRNCQEPTFTAVKAYGSRVDAQKWKKPPCMKCGRSKCRHGRHHRYDSVLGSGDDMLFREFVIYDGRQCFPEFVIKYERLGGWEPIHEYE